MADQSYKQVAKYNHLIASGYTEEKARQLSKVLRQDDITTDIDSLGFDEKSAKYIVQEISHDPSIRPETRLKGAAIMLDTLGLKGDGSKINITINQITGMRVVFDNGTNGDNF
jgi:hypothetical protein